MKLGIFTDSHYSSQEVTNKIRFNSKSLEKIRQAYSYFEKEKCDLIICLGDLIDTEASHDAEVSNLTEISKIISASAIKTVCIMGNHDAFAFTKDEFYSVLKGCEPKNIEIDGKNLIFLDACFFNDGNHYQPGDTNWKDTYLPDADKLKDLLSDEAYIFIHQNIDPSVRKDHRLSNADQLIDIFEKSKCVKAVYQGHYHAGNTNEINGIKYITFPAMCENEDSFYIEEI